MSGPGEPNAGELAWAAVTPVLEQYPAVRGLRAVWVAVDTAEPPLLAYLTHFPRLSIAFGGRRTLTIARDGESAEVCPAAGDVAHVPANCGNLPDCDRPDRDLTFLLGKQHVRLSLVDLFGGGAEPASAPSYPEALIGTLDADPLGQ